MATSKLVKLPLKLMKKKNPTRVQSLDSLCYLYYTILNHKSGHKRVEKLMLFF